MKPPEMPFFQHRTEGGTTALFVTRLQRLLRLRREYCEDLNPLGLRLLDRAIYATYRDCVDYGAEDEAEALMQVHPNSEWKDSQARGP